jgi:hypothetical protein
MPFEYLPLPLKYQNMFKFNHTLVRRCQHTQKLEKEWTIPFETLLPLEILNTIRLFIHDAPTYLSFALAFNLPLCRHFFCQVLAEQKWLEDDSNGNHIVEQKNIAETEYCKIFNDLRYHSLLFPTSYKISKRENGYAITSFKKHLVPFDYHTFFSTPSRIYTPYIDRDNFEAVQNDAEGRHFVYTPYRIIHIYHPRDHKHFLGINTKLPSILKKKYKEIDHVFTTLKITTLKIEPWSLLFHQTKKIEPCQEWIDYLVMIYDFQQQNSQVLKNFKLRVS